MSIDNKETLASRAAQLHIYAKGLAEGFKSGTFRSIYHGQGIEFSGVREYLRGDDVRSIDWNVTARMGKAFVKLFEEETDITVFFIIDRSLSMYTGSKKRTRLDAASEAAALLAFAAEHNNYPAGAVLFNDAIEHSVSPASGRDRTMLLLSWLDHPAQETHRGSVLSNALRGAAQLLKKRSIVFVFSDFRTTGYESELGALAAKHDVIAIRMTDKSDSELPETGTIPFSDTESNLRMVLPTNLTAFRRFWRDDNQKRAERFKTMCLRHGVTPASLSTTEDPVTMLQRLFATRTSI